MGGRQPVRGWQANKKRTCAQPVSHRAMPENEIPPRDAGGLLLCKCFMNRKIGIAVLFYNNGKRWGRYQPETLAKGSRTSQSTRCAVTRANIKRLCFLLKAQPLVYIFKIHCKSRVSAAPDAADTNTHRIRIPHSRRRHRCKWLQLSVEASSSLAACRNVSSPTASNCVRMTRKARSKYGLFVSEISNICRLIPFINNIAPFFTSLPTFKQV